MKAGILIAGGIRSFVIERGIVGQGGVGDVIYRNGEGAGGFDFVGCEEHGAVGSGRS